jgi:exodeoxyribonuclease-3
MWQLFFGMSPMKIYTWNVNSVRTRLEQLIHWLEKAAPEVVLLQEIKVQENSFPSLYLEDLGYNIAVFGQKSYNGVAILSKYPLEDIRKGFPDQDDPQARYLEAVTNGVRVASLYVPNGQEVGCEKYAYKLRFMKELDQHLKYLLTLNEKAVIGGDYNIAPSDSDVYDPKKFSSRILASPKERQTFRCLTNQGWIDAAFVFSQAERIAPEDLYTWWDYRQGSWEQNKGLRIDHLLLSPQAADQMTFVEVCRDMRALPRPSDHAPVGVHLL